MIARSILIAALLSGATFAGAARAEPKGDDDAGTLNAAV